MLPSFCLFMLFYITDPNQINSNYFVSIPIKKSCDAISWCLFLFHYSSFNMMIIASARWWIRNHFRSRKYHLRHNPPLKPVNAVHCLAVAVAAIATSHRRRRTVTFALSFSLSFPVFFSSAFFALCLCVTTNYQLVLFYFLLVFNIWHVILC